eukprot:NODE_5993_length_664_cov_43.893855_g5970_i0.p2 GENE.NODE_5993_length_664_cov_43.893855_g5970_i0~~NODE_5993_length_664_cov_43.893855_g5970_i0.p2  ORF type:complete len:124 (+),score=0.40 NODE_5993_length_664_cov_43.893855_g5970_i0:236-607(+)
MSPIHPQLHSVSVLFSRKYHAAHRSVRVILNEFTNERHSHILQIKSQQHPPQAITIVLGQPASNPSTAFFVVRVFPRGFNTTFEYAQIAIILRLSAQHTLRCRTCKLFQYCQKPCTELNVPSC